ncbi:MAG TPA: methyltransferase domain-containing protein [Streptosporangiaceae bacterium]|nr:methyltransferase domain-containing protein [Streptosporangiaceae bacterium]
MASEERSPGLDVVTVGPGPKGKHRALSAAGHAELFTRFVADYAALHSDRPITVLQAGCATAGPEIDLAALRASGVDLVVSGIDDDCRAARAAVARRPELRSATLGELRLVPLTPRSFDIVQCSMLLHRIGNAELVLGRLVGALRPGGLLLLRTADRQSAAGLLDRKLPTFLRAIAWQAVNQGQPGPFPARYEPIASAQGLEAFVTRHGLVIAHRGTCRAPGRASGWGGVPVSHTLVNLLSGGRYASGHDELRYVIRKREDPDARILQ